MKVICAGAPKTGTKSMAKALRILGYGSVYDIEEAIEYAFKEWEDVWEGRSKDLSKMMDSVYADVDAVVDMPHSYFFDQFLDRWPESKVILMVRDKDSWFTSYKNMVERAQKNYCILLIFYHLSPSIKRMANWYMKLSEITVGSGKPQPFLWKTWFTRHNAYVRTVVPPKQLLEFDVKEVLQCC
uniref:Sulfotransferase n=1 Tax=Ciona savignyi TaxID=51511 RepID=H2ZK49_CIOSA